MRNLKKILALVLALVMSMSLMATANAFTDDANVDATYDEAVTVLSNLKVFQGYDDGSFQPKGSITRAEVAAIIYRIATGDVTDSQVDIYADYNKFDDVKSTSWYAGYVNYCANAEYIKGYDAKTFGPNDPVTGYQALAMILRAVGYDKNGEFTGSNWQVQTASVGKQLHITDKVSAGTLGTAATREVVAEILFRSILVPQVTYTPALGYQSIGVATNANIWTGWFVDNASIGAETFGLAQTTGEITATNRKTGTTTLTPVISRWGDDNRLDTANRVDVINTTGDWTQIGYAAYVYTVPTANAKTRTAVSDVTLTGTSLGTSTNGTTIANLSTKGNAAFIGELAGTGTTVRYYYNGVETTQAIAAAAADRIGVKVDFIDNDNGGLVEVVVVTDYTAAYVTGIANTNNTGAQAVTYNAYNLTTADGSDVANAVVKDTDLVCSDTLAVGDLVTYVKYADDYYVVKAPLTTNTFTRINYSTVGSVNAISYVIGGTEYLVSDRDVKGITSKTSVAKANLNSGNLSKNFNVYTDPYGHVIYAAPVADVVSYLYVLANDHTVATTELTNARIVNTDGSIANVNIAGLSLANGTVRTDFDLNDLITDHGTRMYGYTVNANGSYTLVECSPVLTSASYTTGTSTVYGDEGTAGVNTTSVVVDVRGVNVNSTSATVYTGYGEIPTFTEGELYYTTKFGGWVTVSFLADGKNLADEFIVYKTSYNYTEKVNGTQYYYLDVMKGGVKTENYQLTEDEYECVKYYGVGVYSFKTNGDLNEYTAFPEEWTSVIWENGSIKTADGSYYTYDGANVKFNVLNITNGTINDYVMSFGGNYHAYLVKSGTAVKEIYIVVGELASLPELDPYMNPAYQYKDNAWYIYAKTSGYITDVLDTVVDLTAAPTVTLNGEKLTWASPLSATQFTAALSYEEWSNLPANSRFEVTPAISNVIAVNNKLSFSDEVQYVAVTAKADGYQVITVYSQSKGAGEITESYTFTIYFAPAETGAVLTSEKKEVATIDQATKGIKVENPKLSIKEFKANFKASEGATVEWTFWNAQGIVAEKDYFQTMENVSKFTAVVTAQDGTTATYMDKASADVKALDDAKDAAEKALTEYVGKVEASDAPDVKDVTAEDLAAVLRKEIAEMKKLTKVEDVNAYVKEDAPFGTGIRNIWDEACKIQDGKDAAAAKTAIVKTYEDLDAAINNSQIETIVLANDIALDARITINAGVTLDGAEHTLTAPNYRNSSTVGAEKGAILVSGGTVKNLKVVGPNSYALGWDGGEYGIKVYTAGSVLENVTVTGANAGIQIAADTTLKGTINVSGNEWGGIEVKKSATLTLDKDAVLVNTTETHDQPTVWIDNGETGFVVDNGKLHAAKVTVESKEKQYFYVDAANVNAD